MANINVLIYNPLKSYVADELYEIITRHFESQISVQLIDSSDISLDNRETDLVFIILDQCTGEGISELFNKVHSSKVPVPQVAVLGCDKECSDCPLLQKVGWNFITIPLKPQDVILNIKRYSSFFTCPRYHDFTRVLKNQAMLNILQGQSPPMMEVKNKLLQVAPYNINVLLQGETGTGKELCAKIIHFCSDRSNKPFVPVNCGAVPGELFENELFGHKKGAYTNADSNEIGMIASAQNGTLFLDEIESVSDSAQVKLLRFLEEKRYKPLGDPGYKEADVRIITAVKNNLQELVRKGKFREDLYFRINVVQIDLPPLHKRRDDIPLLVNYFIERYSTIYTKSIIGLTSLALLKLLNYPWPGNVRELENSIQEAVVTCDSKWIDVSNINLNKINNDEFDNTIEPLNVAKQKHIKEFEKTYLENVLEVNKGNISKSAKLARKDRRSFCRLMKKYNIDPAHYRK
jgi:two-component system, NtrC family, response regulator GlrR